MNSKTTMYTAVLIFDNMELLDFAGPYETLSVVNRYHSPVNIRTIAPLSSKPIVTSDGVRIIPDSVLEEVTKADLMIIPGGQGTKPLADDKEFCRKLRDFIEGCQSCLSVCTGSRILASCGVLDGRRFTSHYTAIDEIESRTRGGKGVRHTRYVESENIITAAGISAGIDAALKYVERRWGHEIAVSVSRHMEYQSEYWKDKGEE